MKINFRFPVQQTSDAGSGGGQAAAAGTTTGQASTTGSTDTKPDAAATAAAAGGGGAAAAGSATAAAGASTDTKPQATDTGSTAGAQTPKAPDTYSLTVPDGGRIDPSDLKFVEEVARKNAWTNEEAQAALNEHDAVIKAQADRFLAETNADKTYGGEKLAESQRLAKQVIDRIRPAGHPRRESFQKFLNRGGAGNHLEVVAFFADLGKLMAEDGAVGGSSSAGQVDAAEKLYGSSNAGAAS